jgi:hypothetical protein
MAPQDTKTVDEDLDDGCSFVHQRSGGNANPDVDPLDSGVHITDGPITYDVLHIDAREALGLISLVLSEPFCFVKYDENPAYAEMYSEGERIIYEHCERVRVVLDPEQNPRYGESILTEFNGGYLHVISMNTSGCYNGNVLGPGDIIKFPNTKLALMLTGEPCKDLLWSGIV